MLRYDRSLSSAPSAPAPLDTPPRTIWARTKYLGLPFRQAIGDLPTRMAGQGPDQFISRLDTSSTKACARIGDYAALFRPTTRLQSIESSSPSSQ